MKFNWPSRVWEPTGISKDGKTLWSSREVTSKDIKRRKDFEEKFGQKK